MMSNNKLKIISLLSSITLWFYVIAIINPQSTLSMEGLIVNISNTVELSENNLTLLTDLKPTIDLTLEGRISDLRKLKKENIRASMEITNPSEGKNEALINVSVPENIKYTLDENVIMVQLEKTINKEYEIFVEASSDLDISDYKIIKSINSVNIVGPRSAISKVDKVIAIINQDNFVAGKNISVQLKAVDLNGDIVENATLENSIIQIKFNKITQKEVLVEPIFDTVFNKNSIKINPDKIIIYGESEHLDGIDVVYTKPINVKKLNSLKELNVEIELPENISTLKTVNNSDIELKNEVTISLKNR